MSLHNSRARGAAMVEYALLLLLFIGCVAAIRATGFSVRDAFAASSGSVGESQTTAGVIDIPERRDGGK